MVLKSLFFLLFSVNAYSIHFKELEKVQYLFKLQNYDEVIDYIEDKEEELSYKNNSDHFDYYALSLERKEKYKDAIKVYKKLIRANYKKLNRTILIKVTRKKVIPKKIREYPKLIYYYEKLLYLYVAIYENLNEYTSTKTLKKYERLILIYKKFINIINKESPVLEIITERINTKKEYINDRQYKFQLYFALSIISWQDELFVDNGNSRSKVLQTSLGSCTGLGGRWQNNNYEWNLEGCYISANSTATTQTGTLSYNQSNVPVTGVYIGTGVMFKNLGNNISYGLQLNGLSRKGNWTKPTNVELENINTSKLGYSVRTRWSLTNYSFVMSLGKLMGDPSTVFLLSSRLHY